MAYERITTTGQYLTFRLAEEIYAIDINKVREVLEFNSVTKVPRTPDFMRGVINLRGGVVPVVDMRLKFNMSRTEKTIDTCIVIVEIDLDNERTVLGAMVDSVREVMELEPDCIEPPPRIGMQLQTNFIRGMGKKNDQFIIILDIDNVFSSNELSMVNESVTMAPTTESPET